MTSRGTHVTNGDIATEILERSGIEGAVITFRESLMDGPVSRWQERDWLDERARHLSAETGEPLEATRRSLERQHDEIRTAIASSKVTLWFEQDLFCSIHLWYLLARIAEEKSTDVALIFPGEHPSTPRFRGLGELSPADFRVLYDERLRVSPRWVSIGRKLWEAYSGDEPEMLLLLDTEDFPFAKEAVRLHASRYPSREEGLGAIELSILHALEEKPLPFPALFSATSASIGRFGAGDLHVSSLLRLLASASEPLVTVVEYDGVVEYALTASARAILEGRERTSREFQHGRWIGGFEMTRDTIVYWNRERSAFERT